MFLTVLLKPWLDATLKVIGSIDAFLAGNETDHCCRSLATAVLVTPPSFTVTFSQMIPFIFLTASTLGILVLGIVAFAIGTASGVLMAKLMNVVSPTPINPIIGAAGVSAVPMAARVANKVGLESNPQNFLLMHAMGPNVAGVIGSAVAAGIMLLFAGSASG